MFPIWKNRNVVEDFDSTKSDDRIIVFSVTEKSWEVITC